MAKKKTSNKKHVFKYAAPSAAGATAEAAVHQASTAPTRETAATMTTTDGRNFAYVRRDLARLGLFAATLLALELALWLAVDYTSFGRALYSLIKL